MTTPCNHDVLLLSRKIWNLRARAEKGEKVAAKLAAALKERNEYQRNIITQNNDFTQH